MIVLVVTKSLWGFVSNQAQYSMESAMMMFCSLAIVTYTYRNKILWQKIHRRIYIRLKQLAAFIPTLPFTHTNINTQL